MSKWCGNCSVDYTQYQCSKCFIGILAVLWYRTLNIAGFYPPKKKIISVVVLKRKLRTYKFNNTIDWNNNCLCIHISLFHMFYQCLNSSFASFSFLFCCGVLLFLMYYCVLWIWSGNLYCILCLYIHFILHA